MMNKYSRNPVISIDQIVPSRPDYEVIGAFNAGVAKYKGKVILLLRVAERPVHNISGIHLAPVYDYVRDKIMNMEFKTTDINYDFSDPRIIKGIKCQTYLTSISHIRLAVSDDGYHFNIAEHPVISASDEYSAFGVEDPRITQMGEEYYINFSVVSVNGVATRLVRTQDFNKYHDMGIIFYPDNKDVAIFPQKINGKYYALHRPAASELCRPQMWIAQSDDLRFWGNHVQLAKVRDGSWDSSRIGAGAVPILTKWGWLEIYHGADNNNRYCLGAMLLDKDNPTKVLRRSINPLVEPTEPYECHGFFGNVIFSCGLLQDGNNLHIYYGASDESIARLDTTIDYVLSNM